MKARNLSPAESTPPNLDTRQIRSREALRAAFLILLEEKSLEQISIREIARVAGLGHATFYRQFSDKNALLQDLAAEQIRKLVELTLPVVSGTDHYPSCLLLAEHVNEHRILWTTLLTGGASSTVKLELINISQDLASRSKLNRKDTLPTELKATLVVTSILETLSWWLQQPKPVSTRKIAGYLAQIIMT